MPLPDSLARRRLCLIAPGPDRDPETDRIMRRLAALAAEAGAEAVLLTPEASMPAAPEPGPVPRLPCPTPPQEALHAAAALREALGVVQRLRALRPELVVAAEAGGLGYAVAALRRLGLDFVATRLLVLGTGPRGFRAALDGRPPAGREDLALDHLERCSLAWADAAVIAAPDLADWLRREEWSLPAVLHHMPPPAPRALQAISGRGTATSEPAAEPEILFPGDLRRGAGLPLLVQALRRLPAERRTGLRVTLLGRQPREPWAWPAMPWLAAAMPPGLDWRVEAPPQGASALAARLARPGSIVVAPGRLPPDEATRLCRATGIPVIAPDSVAPRPGPLAEAIAQALDRGLPAAAAEPDAFGGRAAWAALLAATLDLPLPSPAEPGPLDGAAVSVVLIHRNRPALLAQALDGLRAQTLPGFEVVLVDDGSDQPAALAALDALEPDFAERGWRILRQENGWAAAARNAGWRASRGRWVLFHDDDNIAMPHQLATLLAAARHSGAAVVSCFPAMFRGDTPPAEEAAPLFTLGMLGDALAAAVFDNVLGDMHALVRRDLLEAMDGLEVVFGLGHEDWSFFARAALAGHAVMAVPEALYWYRIGTDSMTGERPDAEPAYRRSLAPFAALLPPALRPALELAEADVRRLAASRQDIARLSAGLAAAEARAAEVERRAAEVEAARHAALEAKAAAEAELAALAATLRAEATEIGASRSMRIAQAIGLGRALPAADPPHAPQELDRLRRLRASAGWEATAPLRLLGKLLARLRAR
ncbi:glycosyltransferase family A protein [Roseomonas sp. AR75]|uniref:glycosyltransferase family A protein n=1 Tax=Roseomonas sp. AR75 TaxID=2562311 RepID=UPI0010C043F6|nr:glycosyltransferase family A protein [Roseomonas sp. AR75]